MEIRAKTHFISSEDGGRSRNVNNPQIDTFLSEGHVSYVRTKAGGGRKELGCSGSTPLDHTL
jgi:hypothetical protein